MSEICDSWKEFIVELQERILPSYQSHEQHFDWSGIHGRMHICRALIFAEAMGRAYLDKAENVDFFAIRRAVAFHDAGRQGNGPDLWEMQSRQLCWDYVGKFYSGEEEGYAEYIGQLIIKGGENDLAYGVVHDSDVLEIMRPCCGHGGINAFRQGALRFAGKRDPLASRFDDPEDMRQQLINDAWNFIVATEKIKQNLNGSKNYLADLLEFIKSDTVKYPILSGMVGES